MGPFAARRLVVRDIGGPWRPLAALGGEPDGSLAEIVTGAALCQTDDLAGAVAMIRRVLEPGGRLVFLEHVGRPGALGVVQRLSSPAYAAMPLGCHVDHDVPGALRAGGFVVEEVDRVTVPSVVPLLRHWVRGVARSRA
jgi:hypothetical protein